MKPKRWILIFLLALAGDIVGIQLKNDLLLTIFKPILIPILVGYFLSQTGTISANLKKWIIAALLFSLAGDVSLMFQEKNSLFFLLGLSAFLLAHIFYIILFFSVRKREGISIKPVSARSVAARKSLTK